MATRQTGRHLVLDLGTSTVRLAFVTPGKVPPAEGSQPAPIQMPALTLVDSAQHSVVAMGAQATTIARGTLPDGVAAVRPVREGRIAAYDPAVALVRAALHAALGGESALRRLTRRPRVLFALAATATDTDRRTAHEVLRAAGFGTATPVPQVLAAAVGAGLPVQGNRPRAVCELGAGLVTVAVLAGGQVQQARSWPLGGDWLDQCIARAVQHRRGIPITRRMAEEARREFGALDGAYDYQADSSPAPLSIAAGSVADDSVQRMVQRRRGLGTGELMSKVGAGGSFGKTGGGRHNRSRAPEFNAEDIEAGLRAGARELIERLVWFWEDLDSGLRQTLAPDGLLLTGGAALLPGLDGAIARALGVPAPRAADPAHAVLRGLLELGGDRANWRAAWAWPAGE